MPGAGIFGDSPSVAIFGLLVTRRSRSRAYAPGALERTHVDTDRATMVPLSKLC